MKIKAVCLAIALSASAHAGQSESQESVPAVQENWEFKLSMPGWITWMQGENTLNGHTAHIDLNPAGIIPRIDMTADVRLEAHKGRFSVMGEFLYLSLSDGVGTNTAVKKLDLQIDQMMADVGVAWRIYESPRAYVDLIGGIRYTNFYQQIAIQPNQGRVEQIAGKLAVVPAAVNLAKELKALAGSNPTVPIAPIDAQAIRQIQNAVKKVKGTIAQRQEKIAKILNNALDRTASRLDDWWDPYIGARCRYNLSDKYYLAAKADVGGFGIGSEISWQAEAAFGMMLTKNVFSEVGYRAIGVNYDQNGMRMETITHGVQLTLGVAF